MSNIGYVYVLANSSMPELIKVGKTQRSPSERAKELSSSTATPTPFIVIYEQMFADCDQAEIYIHSILEDRGYREATNREFFRVPPKDIIDIIMSTPGKLSNAAPEVNSSTTQYHVTYEEPVESRQTTSSADHWSSIWDEAEAFYYGDENTLQNFSEAMKLYTLAARLNCPMAHRKIGQMYEMGDGVRENDAKALEFYQNGIAVGDYYCYLNIALMNFHNNQDDNRVKALRKL